MRSEKRTKDSNRSSELHNAKLHNFSSYLVVSFTTGWLGCWNSKKYAAHTNKIQQLSKRNNL